MARTEKCFTLICPSCNAHSIVGLSELARLRVRSSVLRWPCQVCEKMVEMGTKDGIVTKAPRKLTREEKARLKGKGKRGDGK